MSDSLPNGDTQNSGGLGERTPSPRSYGDARLLQRAARERWPIPRSKRPMVVNAMLAIVESPDSSDRARTAAARVLMQGSKINLDSVRTSCFVKRLGQAGDSRENAEADGIALAEHFAMVRRLAAEEDAERNGDTQHQP